jgi:hypothetical protein
MKKVNSLKLTLFFFVFVLFSTKINAQIADSIYDKGAELFCKAAEEMDFEGKSSEDIKMSLGLKLIGMISMMPADVQKKLKNAEDLQTFSEQVGAKAVFICPKVFMAFMKNEEFVNDVKDSKTAKKQEKAAKSSGSNYPPPPPPPPTDAEINGIEAKVKDVIENDYVTLILVDKKGKEYRVEWREHFDGDANFTSNPQGLKNKNVRFGYSTNEWYVPKMHTYYDIKKLTFLKLK